MAKARFCKRCQRYHLHDKIAKNPIHRNMDMISRVFLGIMTGGIHEMMITYIWKCQRCGNELDD